jgi:fermentation-respiration switch protein FrsA (DUF1100 family)
MGKLKLCLVALQICIGGFLFAADGASIYKASCGVCHDASFQTRAPSPALLHRMSPESIVVIAGGMLYANSGYGNWGGLPGNVLLAFEPEQEKKLKTGLTPDDWKYTLAAGVTAKEVTYYSDGVACYAKILFPAGFSAQGKTPAVVSGQGWAGTHYSIEKYGARFAERGLVAMVIDYRGRGLSDGFVSIPGAGRVDGDRIGVWGSSYAGGLSLAVAGQDARVKAISIQVPAVGNPNAKGGPYTLRGPLLEDAIKRARTGQGAEYETGFSARRMIDVETQQATAEFNPSIYLPAIGTRPVMMVVAEKDELIPGAAPRAALDKLTGPKDLIEVKGITHFEMYINEAFEISSKAAADWFVKYLELK